MDRRAFCALLPAAAALRPAGAASTPPPRERLLFRQRLEVPPRRPAGAEAPSFDAAAWRTVDLPHDWSIEGKIDPKTPMGGSGGYFPAGIGWYRRTFTAPAAWKGKRISVEFEGVYMNATVYINGHNLGMHPYGYTTFLARPHPAHQLRRAQRAGGAGGPVPAEKHALVRRLGDLPPRVAHVTEPVHVAQWGVSSRPRR